MATSLFDRWFQSSEPNKALGSTTHFMRWADVHGCSPLSCVPTPNKDINVFRPFRVASFVLVTELKEELSMIPTCFSSVHT